MQLPPGVDRTRFILSAPPPPEAAGKPAGRQGRGAGGDQAFYVLLCAID